MYEDFFGLKDRPFSITPSADLYFDSSVHRRTLAYLRCGVSNGDSLVVMTGEIGAGKTTLLQTLMRDLEVDRVVPATLSNTQLDAAGVTESILLAFGAPAPDRSMAGLEAALDAHLSRLAAGRRRGLAIVDEAQNLPPEALRQLLHLSTRRPAAGAPLQLLLSGQPGLRGRLLNTATDEIGQPVCLFCHVGPLDGAETRSYIEHRLQRLGAAGAPAISSAAFDAIHRATGGIPRRINRLCDRVLLAAYLANRRDIDEAVVAKVDADLRREFGDPEATSLARRSAAEAATAATDRAAQSTEAMAAAPTVRAAPSTEADRTESPESAGTGGATGAESVDASRSSSADADEIATSPAFEPEPAQTPVAEKHGVDEPALAAELQTPALGEADRSSRLPDDATAPSLLAPRPSSSAASAGAAHGAASAAPASFSAPPPAFQAAAVRVRRRRLRTLFLAAILLAVVLSAGGWFALDRRPSLARDLRAWWTEAFEATRAVVPSARRSSGGLTTARPERPAAAPSGGREPGANPQGAAPVRDSGTARPTPPETPNATLRPDTSKPPVRPEASKPSVRQERARPLPSEAQRPIQPVPAAPAASRARASAEPAGSAPSPEQRPQTPLAPERKRQPAPATSSCTEAMSALGLCR